MKYFTRDELKCKCCDTLDLAHGFIDDLDALREGFGLPMKINSGYRCERHNKAVGGKSEGFHPKGCAVDVDTLNWSGAKKWQFINLAMAKGWSVGVARTFIHCDMRASYPEFGWSEPVFFTY